MSDLKSTEYMYELYCQGWSLREVADFVGISHPSVQKRFKRRGLPTRGRSFESNTLWEKRFWSKVDVTSGVDDCWLWLAYRDDNGYGWVTFDRKRQGAHRVAFELATGEKAGKNKIDHRCLNPSCVNPSHLRLATHKQNMENRSGAQRNSTTGERGVYQIKDKFVARVQHDGKMIHLGTFSSISEAATAVTNKRLELFTHNEIDRIGPTS